MERTDPDTGIVETSTFGISWEPKRDEDGNMTRINPETKVVETSTFGISWDPKRDDEGRMTRGGPDGVVEESTFGVSWDPKRDDEGRMTRGGTDGVVEESTFGVMWDPKRDDDGNMTRRDRKTGVVQKSKFGVMWDPAENDDRKSTRRTPKEKDASSAGGGGSTSESYGSYSESAEESARGSSKDSGDPRLLILGLCFFTLGILLMALGSGTPPFSQKIMEALPFLALVSLCALMGSLLSFEGVRKAIGYTLLALVGAVVTGFFLVAVFIPSYRFGVVRKGQSKHEIGLSFYRVAISVSLTTLVLTPLNAIYILDDPSSISTIDQVLFIVGCVGLMYMNFRAVRSYIKRKEPGKWHY